MSWSGAIFPPRWSPFASAPGWERLRSSSECDRASMPKIDIASLQTRIGSPNYPAAFKPACAGRHKTALGNAAGLTQFGVNLTKLEPGAATSIRHWHEQEDEFVYILQGECILVEDNGETILKAGDCAGWKANVPNG